MPPSLATTRPLPPGRDKPNFANRVARFVKRAPPGGAMLWLATLAAIVLMSTVGAFGTASLPTGTRILFWTLLLGWNAIKWQVWLARTVRASRDWLRAVIAGSLCLNILLPFEVRGALWAVGRPGPVSPPHVWLSALAISVSLAILIFGAIGHRLWPARLRLIPAVVQGPVARSGVDPTEIVAMEAEDHYCRLHRSGGTSLLVYGRFQDGIAELAGTPGAQIHRGLWVAAQAVAGAERGNRRWQLILRDGRRYRVSSRYLPEVRARGWLRPPG
jgi:hypothetical protein